MTICVIDPRNLIWVMPAEGDVTNTTAAVILTGGDPVPEALGRDLPPAAFVIAADSGLHHARVLGLEADLVVGDLDSADAAAVAAVRAAGAEIELHPIDKDATDLELALDAALARHLTPVTVVGGAGWDRIDHLLGNAMVLADPRYRPLDLTWLVKSARIRVIHDRAALCGQAGDTVSLLAVGGPAAGVATTGLRWRLESDDLAPGSTRGISNEMTSTEAVISLEQGTLLAIHVGSVT